MPHRSSTYCFLLTVLDSKRMRVAPYLLIGRRKLILEVPAWQMSIESSAYGICHSVKPCPMIVMNR